MHMTSIGKKTWCQRVRAAIILEGAILLVAAFILWENTAGAGENAVAATSDGTIRWVDFNVPKIRALVETDVAAFFDGDPAAYNYNEIILCYPGQSASGFY